MECCRNRVNKFKNEIIMRLIIVGLLLLPLFIFAGETAKIQQELPPGQSLMKKLKDFNYSVTKKIKLLNAFGKLGFHLQPKEVIETLEYLTTLEYTSKDKSFANQIFIFIIDSLNNNKIKFTQNENQQLNEIILQQLDLCANKNPEWFDKFAQLHYLSTPGTYLNKEKKLLLHYIIDSNSETLLCYYLQKKQIALFGNLLGVFTQSPDSKVYSFFHKKLFQSKNKILKELLVNLYFEYNSLLYSMSTDQIAKFINLLSQSKKIPNEKIESAISKIFHMKLQINSYKIPVYLKQNGIWKYLLFIANQQKSIDCDELLEHLTYQIILTSKTVSMRRLKEYEKLLNDNVNNKKWESKFFYWYIGIGIFTFDTTIAERILNISISKISSFKINNYGNLWLLCYAVSSDNKNIIGRLIKKHIPKIKQELDKRAALKTKNRNYILLSNCYKFLGYKRQAAKVLLVALQGNISNKSKDINTALEELQEITGMKCGINFPAWQKAIDAMPDDKVPAKKNKQKNQPPTDVTP